MVITLADFIEEDLTRRLPKLEPVLHAILAVSYGALVAALAPEMLVWTTSGRACRCHGGSVAAIQQRADQWMRRSSL